MVILLSAILSEASASAVVPTVPTPANEALRPMGTGFAPVKGGPVGRMGQRQAGSILGSENGTGQIRSRKGGRIDGALLTSILGLLALHQATQASTQPEIAVQVKVAPG